MASIFLNIDDKRFFIENKSKICLGLNINFQKGTIPNISNFKCFSPKLTQGNKNKCTKDKKMIINHREMCEAFSIIFLGNLKIHFLKY